MLKPDKDTDPKLSVFNITGLIIRELKQYEVLKYDELLNTLTEEIGESAKDVFLYAVSFLFVLDKIEYLSNPDAFRLKNEDK